MTDIIIAEPPLMDEIDAKFHVRGKPIIFAWGNRIYAPNSKDGVLCPELYAHEMVHCYRQTGDERAVLAWWRNYIDDPKFRAEEEAPAHLAQYRKFCERTKDRNARAAYHKLMVDLLAGPLYGNVMTIAEARTRLPR